MAAPFAAGPADDVQLLAEPETEGAEGAEPPESLKPPIPWSERLPPYYCKNHPAALATRKCEICKEAFCNQCTKMVEDNPLCPQCRAQLKALPPEVQGLPPRHLGQELASGFSYPLKGSGKLMLAMGAVFYWLLSFGGLKGCVLAMAFMYAYFAKVCRSAASGRESPPDWPGPEDFGSALYFLVAKLLSIGPALLYVWFFIGFGVLGAMLGSMEEPEPVMERPGEDEAWQQLAADKETDPRLRAAAEKVVAARHPAPRPPVAAVLSRILFHVGVVFVLYAIGSVYLPMALLALLLYRSYEVLNPGFVIGSIARVPRAYTLVYVVLLVSDSVAFMATVWGNTIPIIGSLIGAGIWLFLMMLQMQVLGQLYHFNQKRLGWFEQTAQA